MASKDHGQPINNSNYAAELETESSSYILWPWLKVSHRVICDWFDRLFYRVAGPKGCEVEWASLVTLVDWDLIKVKASQHLISFNSRLTQFGQL